MDLILNNCINVVEIHVVFHEGENDLFLTMLDWMHSGDPEYLGLFHNFPKVFLFVFFPSFFPYFGCVQDRNPWIRNFAHSHKDDFLNFPRGRKEAKCDYSAAKVSSCGDSSKELKVLHISELKYAF